MEVNGVPISPTSDLADSAYDGVILVTYPPGQTPPPHVVEDFLTSATELDHALHKEAGLLHCPVVSGRRLIVSPTGPITPYHDVRSVGEAAKRGVQRALRAGLRRPILVVSGSTFPQSELVLLLGAFEALYVPLQLRELAPEKKTKLLRMGVYAEKLSRPLAKVLREAVALEAARAVSRDIGGGDPERMSPGRVADYVQQLFAGSEVSVEVIQGHEVLLKEYPLFAAVDRAANAVPRHQGRVVKLEYTGSGRIERTLMLVGKGVTYDTGGADIKSGGAMAGMSRDKCGAAAVVGLLQACHLLSPPHLRVVGALCLARNNVGEESYVADELLVSRSGRRVRVGNTDAEGRMVMGDVLYEMKERASEEVNPHLYTIATLTGHAHRAVGVGYTIVMDNHIARTSDHASKLSNSGASIGDMVEISTIRREDIEAHRGQGEADEVHQAFSKPSTAVERGHQGPAGFLLLVSDLHEAALPYSHLDIAASAGDLPHEPTAAPLLALASLYKLV